MTAAELAKLTAALDDDELALLVHTEVNGLPLVTAARALGWTFWRADRTRKRLARKITRLRSTTDSFRRVVDDIPGVSFPQYQERLDSGRRCWSMRVLPPAYLEVVLQGTPIAKELNLNKVSRTTKGKGVYVKPIEKLKTELVNERALLGRIEERLHRSRLTVEAAETALDQAQAELRRDAVEAVLAERESPSPELKKKLTVLQNAFHNAQAELEAARDGQRVQSTKVDEIIAEVEARELEAQRIAFAPAMKTLYAAFAGMIAAVEDVDKTLEQTGPAHLTEIIFPLQHHSGSEWPDYEKLELRNHLIAMYNAAVNARKKQSTTTYDPKKEVAA